MKNKKIIWFIVALIAVLAIIIIWASLSAVKTAPVATDNGSKINNKATETTGQTTESVKEEPVLMTDEGVALSKEGVLTAGGDSFSPKSFTAKTGTNVFLTFSATDGNTHYFTFTDPSLNYIFLNFSKQEGDKSINFPAPAAGTYTFYVDKAENAGTLIVE